jgi:hypothetical protein
MTSNPEHPEFIKHGSFLQQYFYFYAFFRTGVQEMTYYDLVSWMLMAVAVVVFMVWLGLELRSASQDHAVPNIAYARRRRSVARKDDIDNRLLFSRNSGFGAAFLRAAIPTSSQSV